MPTDIDAILAQRDELKRRDPEAILLFRVEDERGDSYRAFGEDARALYRWTYPRRIDGWAEITGEDTDCVAIYPGALNRHLEGIAAAGKRAAVCEQIQGPTPAWAKVKRIVTEPVAHRIILIYSSDDDGIWIQCSCGYRENLDFDPTIQTVVAAARSHHEVPAA